MEPVANLIDQGRTLVFVTQTPDSQKAVNHAAWTIMRQLNKAGLVRCWIVSPCEFLKVPKRILRNSVVVINGLGTVTSAHFVAVLFRSLHSYRRGFLWHETSWNFWAIKNSRRIRFAIAEFLLRLSFDRNSHWVVSRDSLHLVSFAFRQPLNAFSIVQNPMAIRSPKNQRNIQRQKPDATSPFRVVGAGLTNRRKGYDRWETLIKLAESLSPGNFRFTWYSQNADPRAKRGDLRYSTNLIRSLRSADIFVLTSRDDPDPIVVHEARAVGVPFIAYQTVGVSSRGDCVAAVSSVQEMWLALCEVREKILNSQFAVESAETWEVPKFLTAAKCVGPGDVGKDSLPGGGLKANFSIDLLACTRNFRRRLKMSLRNWRRL